MEIKFDLECNRNNTIFRLLLFPKRFCYTITAVLILIILFKIFFLEILMLITCKWQIIFYLQSGDRHCVVKCNDVFALFALPFNIWNLHG